MEEKIARVDSSCSIHRDTNKMTYLVTEYFCFTKKAPGLGCHKIENPKPIDFQVTITFQMLHLVSLIYIGYRLLILILLELFFDLFISLWNEKILFFIVIVHCWPYDPNFLSADLYKNDGYRFSNTKYILFPILSIRIKFKVITFFDVILSLTIRSNYLISDV